LPALLASFRQAKKRRIEKKMRFLFINPHYPLSENPSPPLGLAYLAAVLERAGMEVKIIDFVVYPYSKSFIKSVMDSFLPDVVCATCVTMTFYNAIKVIKDVKSIDPGMLTVMGGPHVSFCAEEMMNIYPELDLVVKGEGEETVIELIDAIKGKKAWNDINGIVYRNGSEIIETESRTTWVDVNSLPVPARHLLPLGRYRALNMSISMTTSRGCPFKCIFCVGRKMVGAKVRYRNAENVVDELEYLGTLGFPQVNIADDLFTANKRHCFDVCDEIIRRNLDLKWSSFARVDTVSVDVLKRMKEAGCTAVSFGVETGNPEILKTIKKGITIDQVVAAVEMCNEANIIPTVSFILGLPGETPETMDETIAFGEKLKNMGVLHGFHLLAPFPGTKIREESETLGIKILTDDWSQYHANRAIVETPTVSLEMFDEFIIGWEKIYDEHLEEIGRRMKTGEASEEEASQIINLERTVLVYDRMMAGM
jgi:anaerobic magnesium-protoporphyrin IX monomethyl ester cyclase